ncbi:MAG: Tim44/TimA family putative adaptor protein, partial [Pseudomonadota bacterium]
KGTVAQVTVKIHSQLISATRDKAGEVVDGDPAKVTEVVDIWTFARDTHSRDPNWKLVATESAE